MRDTTIEQDNRDGWEEIERTRNAYANAVAEARDAVRRVNTLLDELCGDRLYDVEYAEGGPRVDDMTHYLTEASRAMRMIETINAAILPAKPTGVQAQMTIHRPDDETVEIIIGDETVTSANHGRDGIDAVVSAASRIASALGVEVIDA